MSGLWDGGPGEVSDWLCALGVGGDRCKPQGGVPGGGTPSAGIGGGTIALIAAAGIAAVLVLRK